MANRSREIPRSRCPTEDFEQLPTGFARGIVVDILFAPSGKKIGTDSLARRARHNFDFRSLNVPDK